MGKHLQHSLFVHFVLARVVEDEVELGAHVVVEVRFYLDLVLQRLRDHVLVAELKVWVEGAHPYSYLNAFCRLRLGVGAQRLQLFHVRFTRLPEFGRWNRV